jgi:Trk K+ transport system NAD-binding subunit
MKIIILGAGQVGSNLAEHLVREGNDLTVVDLDAEKLAALQDRFDLRTICGQASHPSILKQAGADDADMLVAVTLNDETNIVACKLAGTLFNIPTKIARIRALDYMKHPQLFDADHFGVDHVIAPEQEITDYLRKLIDYPEALQVVDFGNGRARLVAMKARAGGPLVGHELRDLQKHLPGLDARVAAIFRRDRTIVPEGRTVIQDSDEIFFIAATENIRAVMKEMRRGDKSVRRVMIAGGGNIGQRLARSLEIGLRGQADRPQQEEYRAPGQHTEKHPRAHRRRHRRGPAAPGKHRGHGRVLRPHQRRRGQHHVVAAGEAARRQEGHRPDQPLHLRGSAPGRRDRHRPVPGPGHHRPPAHPHPARRHGGGAFPAPGRRRSPGSGGARRRPEILQAGRQAHRGGGTAGGGVHRRRPARHPGQHRPPRHSRRGRTIT